MAKIAFYANNLSERGTAVALFDYAKHNRDLLGNESLIVYDKEFPGNHPSVIEKFNAEFELIGCRNFSEADSHSQSKGCDLMYILKSGKRDDLISRYVPTMVHAVFSSTVNHVHGASYAYVSDWLADHCSGGRVPWVPHIVEIGESDDNLRREFGIPEDGLVFGSYGGKSSFDIDFVRNTVVPRALESFPNVYFLFMNIEKFIEHPRAIFRAAAIDLEEKTKFINTCDAMLHARRRGETFGLAVGEFSLGGKPVLTYGRSKEQAHLKALGDSGQIYRNADELYETIARFDKSSPSAKDTYLRLFSPQSVMKRFEDHLIKPAERGDLDGARKMLGFRRWDPILLARPKLKKVLNRL